MDRDLRRWDDDCVNELCDIVFGQFLLGNFAAGLPREPLWDVITNTLNARTGKDFTRGRLCVGSCWSGGSIVGPTEFVMGQGVGGQWWV